MNPINEFPAKPNNTKLSYATFFNRYSEKDSINTNGRNRSQMRLSHIILFLPRNKYNRFGTSNFITLAIIIFYFQ